jgi:predicted RNase H-like HicB family nuclease
MSTRVFPALLVKDPDSHDGTPIGVVFPDLPGCVSQGDTLQHAAEMALESLALHIGQMIEDGETVPEPSAPTTVPDWIDPNETAIVASLLVPVEVPGRSVRVNITMDEALLQRADLAASRHGLTRSGLLAEATRAWLRDARRGGRKRAS